MTYPKMKPCPQCGTAVNWYKYDSGWIHVECNSCLYIAPGCGNVTQAIRAHNERVAEKATQP